MKNKEKTKEAKKAPLMFSRLVNTGFSPYKLRDKTVSIIGLGGLGVLVANMLIRLGIGNFILVDRDTVGEENLNRLGYSPEDIGESKVSATKKMLEGFSKLRGSFPLHIETYKKNIIAWNELEGIIERSDITFGCLDNLKARLEVNQWNVKAEKPLVDGGTSQNALRGRIDAVIPYKFPCLGCYYSANSLTSLGGEEKDYDCGRSLPTLMNLVASFQVDQGLRILLKKKGVYPRIFINLEGQISVSRITEVERRENCQFCFR